MSTPTAALLIIGNEILSGRTKDKNLPELALFLSDIGIAFKQAVVVPDDIEVIAKTVNQLREQYTYVFTSGGIGATHDDITMQAIAQAFGRKYVRNPEALKILEEHYKEEINETRRCMADMPEGCNLIDNPVSKAPGAIVENVHVMAGIPEIFRAMLQTLAPSLQTTDTKPFRYTTVTVMVPENQLASKLEKVQNRYSDLDIGSYPFFQFGAVGASFIIRGQDVDRIQNATNDLIKVLDGDNIKYELKPA